MVAPSDLFDQSVEDGAIVKAKKNPVRGSVIKLMVENQTVLLRNLEMEQGVRAGQYPALCMAFTVLWNKGCAHPWDSRWCLAHLDMIKCSDFLRRAKDFNGADAQTTRRDHQTFLRTLIHGSLDSRDKCGTTLDQELKRRGDAHVADDSSLIASGEDTGLVALSVEINEQPHWRKVDTDVKAALIDETLKLVLNMSKPEALAKKIAKDAASPARPEEKGK